MSSDEIEELTTILQTLESDQRIYKLPEGGPEDPLARGRKSRNIASRSSNRYGTLEEDITEEDEDEESDVFNLSRKGKKKDSRFGRFSRDIRNTFTRRRSIYKAKAKISGIKGRALTLLMQLKSKRGMAIRKETRATKLVAIVMVTFLLFWMPFFTMNLIKVKMTYDGTWDMKLEKVFIIFTWLGYLNSCLNPFIYSAINRKFREAFKKILRFPTKESRRKKMIRASQPHLTTAVRSPKLPITTSACQDEPSETGFRQPGSTDQGYASTSLQQASLTGHHSPTASPRMRMQHSRSPLDKRLIRSPSPISEHDTPQPSCSSDAKTPEHVCESSGSREQSANAFASRLDSTAECNGIGHSHGLGILSGSDSVVNRWDGSGSTLRQRSASDFTKAGACDVNVPADQLKCYASNHFKCHNIKKTPPTETNKVSESISSLPLLSPSSPKNALTFDNLSLRNIDSDYATEDSSQKEEISSKCDLFGDGCSITSDSTTQRDEITICNDNLWKEKLANRCLEADESDAMLLIPTSYSGILREEDTQL